MGQIWPRSNGAAQRAAQPAAQLASAKRYAARFFFVDTNRGEESWSSGEDGVGDSGVPKKNGEVQE